METKHRSIRAISVAALFIGIVLLVPDTNSSYKRPPAVSLCELLANAESYDGQAVRVYGFGVAKFEQHALFLHRDDYKHALFQNAVWLIIPEDTQMRANQLHKKYVEVTGVFDSQHAGHMSLYPAAIRVERITGRSKRRGK